MEERGKEEIGTEELDSISISAIYDIVRSNWYWFLLSIIVCLITAFVFYKAQPFIYKVDALIMIKTDEGKGGLPSETAIFDDLGIGNQGNVIENEIYILHSSALINQVIDKLELDVVYTKDSFFKEDDLYNNSPIDIAFVNKDFFIGCEVSVDILDDKRFRYRIYDRVLKSDVTEWLEASFGEEIKSPQGEFVINTTPLYTSECNDINIIARVNSIKKTNLAILKSLTVSRVDKKAGILKLSIDNSSFLCAKQILNTLISVYNDDVIQDKNRVATNTESFILERIESLSIDLDGVDERMAQQKRDNSITDLVSSSGIMLEKGAKYQAEVIRLETEIDMVDFIKEYLLDPIKKSDLIPSISVSDISIGEQIAAYNEELLYLNKISQNAGRNNPVTVDLMKRLNETRDNVIRSIDNSIASLKIQLQQAKTQENITNRRIEDVPTQEKALNIIAREQKIKSELYLYLLNKREENALDLAITESHARIIENADGTGDPVSPSLLIILFISIIIGLLIPSLVLYIKDLMDNKIHNKFEVESKCSVPVLGEVTSIKGNASDFRLTEISRDVTSESYRIVRNNMAFFVKERPGMANVVQLTSTVPGEGKTTAIVNLALSHVHLGKRVLVIDLDLRKGRLSFNMESKYQKGISDYLSEKCNNVSDIIQNSTNDNFHFISTGSIPPNPTNLLLSQRFIDLIEELKTHYDYIFLDTVPALVIADSSIINRVADVTLYIIRSGVVDKRYLVEIEKLYTTNKFNNMAILMTDVNTSRTGYGYGYGYGYGSDEK